MREGGASVYARPPSNLYKVGGGDYHTHTIKYSFHIILLLSYCHVLLPSLMSIFFSFYHSLLPSRSPYLPYPFILSVHVLANSHILHKLIQIKSYIFYTLFALSFLLFMPHSPIE